jgi:hypothetical protein
MPQWVKSAWWWLKFWTWDYIKPTGKWVPGDDVPDDYDPNAQ